MQKINQIFNKKQNHIITKKNVEDIIKENWLKLWKYVEPKLRSQESKEFWNYAKTTLKYKKYQSKVQPWDWTIKYNE